MPEAEPVTPSSVAEDQATGLPIPGLKSWRHVYVFVGVLLAGYVVLLTVLGKVFSS